MLIYKSMYITFYTTIIIVYINTWGIIRQFSLDMLWRHDRCSLNCMPTVLSMFLQSSI